MLLRLVKKIPRYVVLVFQSNSFISYKLRWFNKKDQTEFNSKNKIKNIII